MPVDLDKHSDGYGLINFEFSEYTTVNLLGSVHTTILGVKLAGEENIDSSKVCSSLRDMERGCSPEKLQEMRALYVDPLAKCFAATLRIFCEFYSLESTYKRTCFDEGIGVAQHDSRCS